MRGNNRKSIEKCRKKLPQFTTMNVIDGQAYYCQYQNVQFGQNIFVQNCTFLFSSFCTILFCPIKILMPYLLNLLFYTNSL